MLPFMKTLWRNWRAGHGKATDTNDVERLTEDMRQAFFRDDIGAIECLARRGARFTEDMLLIAVQHRDGWLIERCLDEGLHASDAIIRAAVDSGHAGLVGWLVERADIGPDLRRHIDLYASDEIKKTIEARYRKKRRNTRH